MSKKLLIETHTFRANPVTLTENVNKNNGNLVGYVYTQKDKYEKLVAINPLVDEFRKEFDLDM